MNRLIFKSEFGLANVVILTTMLLIAVSLPIATRLVQNSQENRSRAASVLTTVYSLKDEAEEAKIRARCLSNCANCGTASDCSSAGCSWNYSTGCSVPDSDTTKSKKTDNEYIQLGKPCNLTSRCQEPLICSDGKCKKETIVRTGNEEINRGCNSDSDCVSPYVCYKKDGVCKVRSGGKCTGSKDCYSNHYCSATNNHCRKIDSYWLGEKSVEGESVYSLIHGGSTITPTMMTPTTKKTPTVITPTMMTPTTKKTPTVITPTMMTPTTKKTPTVITPTMMTPTTKKTPTKSKPITNNSTGGRCDSYDGFSPHTDVNGDGVTNSIDLALVKNNLGSTVACGTNGDTNYDGVVNSIDLVLVKNAL